MPALQNGFVNWDDDLYVFKNSNIQSITASSIKWMFTSFHAYNWHPLTWFSLAVDYAMWGKNPFGYHLSNILLHSFNTFLTVVLVFQLIELTKYRDNNYIHYENWNYGRSEKIIAASITGILFGLHPTHVESVAWISERKDLLCSFFYISSVLFYLSYSDTILGSTIDSSKKYITKKKALYYSISILFFVLALLSKPMAVTLPIVLLLLDVYPLQRFDLQFRLKPMLKPLAEKIPFLLLSFSVSAITVSAQQLLVKQYPLVTRSLVAVRSFGFYLSNLFYPTNLAPLYPYPQHISILSPGVVLSLVLLFGITAGSLMLWKKSKMYLTVWLYFLLTLIPVIGLVQVGKQAAADRYLYLPSIGPFLLLGILGAFLWRRAYSAKRFSSYLKGVCITGALIVVACLSILTIRQISIWKDTITLFSREIDKFPDSADAYTIRGLNFSKADRYEDAISDFSKSIALKPSYPPVYKYRGDAYEKLGDFQKALADYNKAIAMNGQELIAYISRGDLYYKLGNFEKAALDYENSIRLNYTMWQSWEAEGLNPKVQLAESYYKCANAYEKLKNYNLALSNIDKAIELIPNDANFYNKRAVIYGNIGDYGKAIGDLNKAMWINPDFADTYNNRAGIYTLAGKYQDAVSDLETAIRLNSQSVDLYVNLGMLYLKLGKDEQAAKEFQVAARMGDNWAQDYLKSKGLGW